MSTRTIIWLCVGCALLQFALGLTASYMVSKWLAEKNKRVPVVTVETVLDGKDIITPGSRVDVLLVKAGEPQGVLLLERVSVGSVKMKLPLAGDPAGSIRAQVALDLENPEQEEVLEKAITQPVVQIVLKLHTPLR